MTVLPTVSRRVVSKNDGFSTWLKTVGVSHERACCLDGPCSAEADTSAQIEAVHADVRNRKIS